MRDYSESRGNFDLLGMMSCGLIIGYKRQTIADSGELIPGKILTSMIIAGSAYLIAFLVVRSWEKIRIWKLPSWIVMAMLGAIVCSFSLHVVYYAIYNQLQYGEGRSVLEYVWWQLHDLSLDFLFAAVVYFLISLCVMGVCRLVLSRVTAIGGG